MKFFGEIGELYTAISNWVVTHFALLFPAGSIAQAERDLMLWATVLMLVVVIPVFLMTVIISVRYRETNTKARFTPHYNHNLLHELIWWGVPVAIVGILAVILWNATHALDPYKSIPSENEPVVIQAISLDWKWLFLYPEEDIATVNTITIPENTPVIFRITSDAPMNALWMPEIAGMIMTMPGMITELNVIVPKVGDFRGMSSNYSGRGFAGMDFSIHVVDHTQYGQWSDKIRRSEKVFSFEKYQAIRKPSRDVPETFYRLNTPNLFRYVVMNYMMPGLSSPEDLLKGRKMQMPMYEMKDIGGDGMGDVMKDMSEMTAGEMHHMMEIQSRDEQNSKDRMGEGRGGMQMKEMMDMERQDARGRR